MKIWLLLGWVTKVSPWSVFLHCTMPCIVMVSRIKQIFGGSFQWGTKTLSDLVWEKGHCSFDETSNIKRSQWETFMSGVEKKNAIWILLNVLTSLCMGALYCLHRFSSTLTVLLEYWQFITTIKPWFSPFLFTGKDQTNSTNCAFQICQTPLHYLHEIGKKIGSLERMAVL